MIHHDLIPRSPEWRQARLGIPTSSEFHRIVVVSKDKDDKWVGKPSKQATAYLHRLLAEFVTGEEVENYESQYMQRGSDLEDAAIAAFEFQNETETSPGGFFTDDRGLVGCSPDRLVGEDGDLEIKSPLAQTQIGYLLKREVDSEYFTQLQGRMWIHGRKYVSIYSYHPKLPGVLIRVERDEQYIQALASQIEPFIDMMIRLREELTQKYGPFVRPQPEPDHSKDWITDQDIEEVVARARERQR